MPCPVGADQRVRPFSSDLRALPCSRKAAAPRGASRQACHAGGRAGRATQSRSVREFPRQPPPRLAAWPARLRTPPQPAAPKWSKPPGLPCRHFLWSKPLGLPCRRSRRQSHTISSCAAVPSPSSPHDCALHLNPPRPVGADQRVRLLFSYLRVLCALCGLPSPCPPWFVFSVPSVSSVVCFFRALRLRALPTPSHNLPQIFFPFLFNHFPTPPFSFSCSPLVC